MASAIQAPTTTDVTGLYETYVLRDLVPGLMAEMIFAPRAEPAQIPKGSGHFVARWNIPTMRNGTTTALADGTSGSAANMITMTFAEATVADYGEWFEIGDLAYEASIPEALDAYREMVRYAGATSIDLQIYNQAKTSSNFLHCGDTTTAGATLANGDQLKLQDFPVIAGFFRTQNAKGWSDLSNDYFLGIHPDVEVNLVTDVTTAALSWSEANKHVPAGFEQLINNHQFVGRFNGVSALRSTLIGTVSEDVAAHQCVAIARYGVGWLGLGENGPKAPQIKIKGPSNSTYDPLDTKHTMGWKVRCTAKLLDSNRALVVYSAVT